MGLMIGGSGRQKGGSGGTEADPIFTGSAASSITLQDILDWKAASGLVGNVVLTSGNQGVSGRKSFVSGISSSGIFNTGPTISQFFATSTISNTYAQFHHTTGNVVFQAPGVTPSDNGNRLTVEGTTLLNGLVTIGSDIVGSGGANTGNLGAPTNRFNSVFSTNFVSNTHTYFGTVNSSVQILFRQGNATNSLVGGFFVGGNFFVQGQGIIPTDTGERLQVAGTSVFTDTAKFTGNHSTRQATFGRATQAGMIAFGRGSDGAFASTIGYRQPTDANQFDVVSGGGGSVLGLQAHGGTITFSGASVEFGRFVPTGNFLLGSFTDSGEKFQVTGNTKITGDFTATGINILGGNRNLTITTSGAPFVFNGNAPTNNALINVLGGVIGSGGNPHLFGVSSTINQSGTTGYRAIYVSVYEQAVGSGIKNLLDLGTNSAAANAGTHTSRFSVSNVGSIISRSNLVATSNDEILVGVDLASTFTNGAFTGVYNYALKVTGDVLIPYNSASPQGSYKLRFGTNGGNTSPKELYVAGNDMYITNAHLNATFGVWVGALEATTNRHHGMQRGGGISSALTFRTNNVERLYLTDLGQLILNTTTNSGESLQITGNTKLDGTLLVTGNATFSGQTSVGAAGNIFYANGNINLMGVTTINAIQSSGNGTNTLNISAGRGIYLTATNHNQPSGIGISLSVTPTYNQTGTAGSTDIIVNRTETSLGSGLHKFMSLQIGGVEQFSVNRLGWLTTRQIYTEFIKINANDGGIVFKDADGREWYVRVTTSGVLEVIENA